MNLCIIIPVVIGLVCALLGYLLGKLLKSEESSSLSPAVYKNRIAQLEAELKACRASMSSQSIPFNAEEAKAVFGKKVNENDLKIIEGIGPKIEELFHEHDVLTWEDLSKCSVEKCQDVLDSGGERYKIHNPKTWPKQALLAFEGKWKELFDWQEELEGGL